MKLFSLSTVAAFLVTGAAHAATFSGEFWDARFNNIGSVISYIETTQPVADLTFESTAIDYPNGGANDISSSTSLVAFLGADGATLSGSGPSSLTGSVFRFIGLVDLTAGNHVFSVGSDDGFRLKVGGTVLGSASDRGFATSSYNYNAAGGLTEVELVYYENGGNTGVEFRVDGALAVPAAAVPLPATALMSLAGLGALGFLRRKTAA